MPVTVSSRKLSAFQRTVLDYYHANGRHQLPWRSRQTAYRVLVSEVMLQQTQVDRVVPKYRAFMKLFPTVHALADAPLGEVLRAWQGLGYNRRAKFLHQCVQVVVVDGAGRFPRTYEGLLALPGIGPYTAAAVMAFAYNEACPLIETNVRTVYIHHFFTETTAPVADQDILTLVTQSLPRAVPPREWYAALMDYGAYLKRTVGNHKEKSAAYVKQQPFQGSRRQVRGAILRALSSAPLTGPMLQRQLVSLDGAAVASQLAALEAEGLVVRTGRRYQLPQ